MYNLEINFLKDREPVKIEGTRRRATPLNERMVMYAGIAAGLLPLALVGGLLLYQQSETGKLEQQLADIKVKSAASNAKLKNVEKLEKEANELDKDAQGLATVFDQIKPWSAMLQDISASLPAGVQVTCVAQMPAGASTDNITNCQGVQPASASSGTTTTTTGEVATDTVVISGRTYNFSSINDLMLGIQRSPFFKPDETRIVQSELKDYPSEWEQVQSSTNANSGQQLKPRRVVEFTIKTSLSDTPASKMLRDLQRRGALGLVTRIDNLRDKGVLQNGLR